MSTSIHITGNVGNDPNYALSKAGNGWIRLNVAVYQGRDQDGNEKKPAWYTVKVFSGKGGESFAENVRNTISKGMRIFVAGNVETEYWTDKDGNERTTQTIIADAIGPDLRFAEAPNVVRNERNSNGGGNAGNGGGYGNRGGYGGGSAPAAEPVTAGMGDDDPFSAQF